MQLLNPTDFGNRLRILRTNAGYTHHEIAALLCCERSSYSYYEDGVRYPPLQALILLANLYRITLDELLTTQKPDTGAGDEFDELTSKERILVGIFRICSVEYQNTILEFAEEEKRKSLEGYNFMRKGRFKRYE